MCAFFCFCNITVGFKIEILLYVYLFIFSFIIFTILFKVYSFTCNTFRYALRVDIFLWK